MSVCSGSAPTASLPGVFDSLDHGSNRVDKSCSIALGALGPTVFNLGLKDSALTILFFNLLTTTPAAYLSTFGARLGLRQMVIGRYSFGPWAVLFPTLPAVGATMLV